MTCCPLKDEHQDPQWFTDHVARSVAEYVVCRETNRHRFVFQKMWKKVGSTYLNVQKNISVPREHCEGGRILALLVSYSVQAAVTEGHRLRALNNRNLFSSRPEGWLAEIKELANSDSVPSESTLPGLMSK